MQKSSLHMVGRFHGILFLCDRQRCSRARAPWSRGFLLRWSRLFCWSCKLVHCCFHFQVSFSLYLRSLFFPGRVRLCQRSAGDSPTGFALTLDFLPSVYIGACLVTAIGGIFSITRLLASFSSGGKPKRLRGWAVSHLQENSELPMCCKKANLSRHPARILSQRAPNGVCAAGCPAGAGYATGYAVDEFFTSEQMCLTHLKFCRRHAVTRLQSAKFGNSVAAFPLHRN